MHRYFFVLGNNHTFSKVEILTILSTEDINFKVIASSAEIIILESNQKIDLYDLMRKLGGTIKVGEIINSITSEKFTEQFNRLITDLNFLSRLFDPTLQTISFGISVYNAGSPVSYINRIFPASIKTLPKIKQFLQSSYKVNFFRSHERYISSVSIVKNKLLTNGFELDICVGDKTIYLGKTLAVQDFEDYSFRDYQRPSRNSEAGMLPPKLAKIMINIASKSEDQVILDPFCGNGTILQELILLGYKNIIGTDYKNEQIQKTNQNINWLFEQYVDLVKTDFNIKTAVLDIRNLSQTFDSKSIDAIITEPFLGSPKLKHFNLSQVEKEISILEKLYVDAFSQFKSILKKDGKVIIVFPIFRLGNDRYFLNVLLQLSRLGFFPIDFPQNPAYQDLHLEISERGSIIYFRPNQIVYREIFIFKVDGEGFEPPTSSM